MLRPRLAFRLTRGQSSGPTEKLLRLLQRGWWSQYRRPQYHRPSQPAGRRLDGWGKTFTPIVQLSSLGNTQLGPERSSELWREASTPNCGMGVFRSPIRAV